MMKYRNPAGTDRFIVVALAPTPSGRDRLVALIKQGNAIGAQDRLNFALILGDQLVQVALPVLIGMSHPHGDPVDHSRAALFLREPHDRGRGFSLRGVVAGEGPPE